MEYPCLTSREVERAGLADPMLDLLVENLRCLFGPYMGSEEERDMWKAYNLHRPPEGPGAGAQASGAAEPWQRKNISWRKKS